MGLWKSLNETIKLPIVFKKTKSPKPLVIMKIFTNILWKREKGVLIFKDTKVLGK